MNWFQGTADAVRQSVRNFAYYDFEYILILSGDQLYQMDFKEMLERHVDQSADVSIATIPVLAHDATSFGIMKVNANGQIEKFIEKPKADVLADWESNTGETMEEQGRIYLASMGIYIFGRKVLFDLLQDEFRDATDFGKEIIPFTTAR